MRQHPLSVRELPRIERFGQRADAERQGPLKSCQPQRPRMITIRTEALEAKRVVTVGAHLAAILKARLPLAARLAQSPIPLGVLERSLGHRASSFGSG